MKFIVFIIDYSMKVFNFQYNKHLKGLNFKKGGIHFTGLML